MWLLRVSRCPVKYAKQTQDSTTSGTIRLKLVANCTEAVDGIEAE